MGLRKTSIHDLTHNCSLQLEFTASTSHSPASTSPPPSCHTVCAPSHPWQAVSAPAACPLSVSQRGQAFFLTESCQDTLDVCVHKPRFNDLIEGRGVGRRQ